MSLYADWDPERVRRVVTGAGSDPSEWPEDLRVRELGWSA